MRKNSHQNYNAIIKAPFATLGLVCDGEKLKRVDFLAPTTRKQNSKEKLAQSVELQIQNYCSYQLTNNTFSLILEAEGTVFQKKVWREISKIPYGKTKTYGEIAKKLKTSPRAVGNACRVNPLVVVVPCHRVVSASGMGGFSGKTDGRMIDVKRWLLEHENAGFCSDSKLVLS